MFTSNNPPIKCSTISRRDEPYRARSKPQPEQAQRCSCLPVLYALNSDCWSQKENMHGYGGVPRDLTLNQCYEACINEIDCVAIDWEPSNAGKTCWILTLTYEMPTTETGVITHYILSRSCLSESDVDAHGSFWTISHCLFSSIWCFI